MKLSLNWLHDFIDLSGISPQEIGQKLSLATCEIEDVYESYGHLSAIQVARISSVEKHPNADRLNLCTVEHLDFQAKMQISQIVCGAANVHSEMLVALAPVGTRLPQSDEPKPKGFLEIRKAKIRGVESAGMLCSAAELGLEAITGSENGILAMESLGTGDYPLIKTGALQIGTPLATLFPQMQDTIFEVDNKSITHRPDLWSHFGFARELSAIFSRPLIFDPLNQRPKKTDPSLEKKQIHIKDNAALAYYGLSVGKVKVKPGPLWMQARLINIGQRPINNIVDSSNYVMFELGQPNHAFDARTIKNKTISVAKNTRKTTFTTLDNKEHHLASQSTILIYDGLPEKGNAVALGGIMGGLSSSIQNDTSELFLESATFPREQIRRSITSLNLRTDSAQRFEKGQDPTKAGPALYRLAYLIKQSCPELTIGQLCGSMLVKPKSNRINVELGFLQKRLGFTIQAKQVLDILQSLNFNVKTVPKQKTQGKDLYFIITVPTYRSQYDVSLKEDIVEEIGRLYGYDNIKAQSPSVPLEIPSVQPAQKNKRKLLRHIQEYLVASSYFNETYNYSFVSKKHNSLWSKDSLALKNPVFENKNELRLNLLPGLLEQAVLNQDRFREVRLFECGRIYRQNANEENRIALLIMLESIPPHLQSKLSNNEASRQYNLERLLTLRLCVENILGEILGKSFCSRLPTKTEWEQKNIKVKEYLVALHPKASILFQTTNNPTMVLGSLGILHPSIAQTFSIKRPTLIADLNFDAIYTAYNQQQTHLSFNNYQKPSVYPRSHFEISLLLPVDTGTHIPMEIVHDMKIKEVQSMRYLNEYQGPPLLEKQKSVSYGIDCGRSESTLTGDELQNILDTIISRLRESGFSLRV